MSDKKTEFILNELENEVLAENSGKPTVARKTRDKKRDAAVILGLVIAIFAIIAGIYLILDSLTFLILSLNLMIKQLILNKKFISWLSLIWFIVAVIGIIVAALFVFRVF